MTMSVARNGLRRAAREFFSGDQNLLLYPVLNAECSVKRGSAHRSEGKKWGGFDPVLIWF
jgi:hypothetical protein